MKPYLDCLQVNWSTSYITQGVHNKAWIPYTMWLDLPESFEFCSSIYISILFQILVTMYKKIRKSQEILGNQDSGIPWILSESMKIWNLVHYFFTLQIPRYYFFSIWFEGLYSYHVNNSYKGKGPLMLT